MAEDHLASRRYNARMSHIKRNKNGKRIMRIITILQDLLKR